MNIRNLVFFDNSGYNLNLEWDGRNKLWAGNIYLPKVSVGLYANTSIYVMEKVGSGENEEYVFPQADESENRISFSWDRTNKFVDEFFMFDFDTEYYAMEDYDTSSLEYTPNNGPDLSTLIVRSFDIYYVTPDKNMSKKALPIHVAFSSPDKYDATTFKRKLVMYYGYSKVAEITYYAETIEEDERLKILTKNLGYALKPEDTTIFKESNIKESYPDYELLNRKRKEILIEGHNIYPYIGSYKAIINAIKFFGYENLNIIEYWRNVDSTSENFGKMFATKKYELNSTSNLYVEGRNIPLPNSSYRKTNNISLVYTINHPTDKLDDFELPIVKEDFNFTMEEVIIKLFALRRKLNSDFMPCSSRIVDIIGEATYFCLAEILNNPCIPKAGVGFGPKRTHHPEIGIFPSDAIFTPNAVRYDGNSDSWYGYDSDSDSDSDFYEGWESLETNNPPALKYNTCTVRITDTRQFKQYAIEKFYETQFGDGPTININTPINNLDGTYIDLVGDTPLNDEDSYSYDDIPVVSFDGENRTEYYRQYLQDIKDCLEDELLYEPHHEDDTVYDENEYYFDMRPSAKIIIENLTLDTVRFGDVLDKFGSEVIDKKFTFGDIDTRFYGYDRIKWSVWFSQEQNDTDIESAGGKRKYEKRDFSFTTGFQDINLFEKIMIELPYVGYYDIVMSFSGEAGDVSYLFKRAVKVEPNSIDIRGFYYDARELPDEMRYDLNSSTDVNEANDEYTKFDSYYDTILRRLKDMTNFALVERVDDESIPVDMRIPYYGTEDSDSEYIIEPGPYRTDCINNAWVTLDNISADITTLEPNVESARYIRNAVDVKPYTWFLLGFNETKISCTVDPVWKLTNITTGESVEHKGKYFTLLLKKEGDYKIDLSFSDINGNKYSISRNIVIVDKNANYSLYKRLKEEIDDINIRNYERSLYEDLIRLEKQDIYY